MIQLQHVCQTSVELQLAGLTGQFILASPIPRPWIEISGKLPAAKDS